MKQNITRRIVRDFSVEDWFYCVGVVLFVIQVVLFILYRTGAAIPTDYFPDCQFKSKIGISCLGCGLTRGFQALYGGHFIQSLKFNPIAMYFTVLYLIYMILNTIAIIRNLKVKNKELISLLYPHVGMRFHEAIIYVGLAIAIVFGVVRAIIEIKNGEFHLPQ